MRDTPCVCLSAGAGAYTFRGPSEGSPHSQAPAFPGADSFLLQRIPLDGTPPTAVPLPGGSDSTQELVVAAGTCFRVVAFQGGAFGTSDLLCGVPGISTLSGALAQQRLAEVAGALGQLRARVE